MPEIDVEYGIDAVIQHSVGAQQIGNGAVAVAGRALRRIDGVVDAERAPGKAAERLADVFEGVVAPGLMDQPGTGDRPGIDHRVEGVVFGVEADRVEGIAGRLDADRAFDAAAPSVSSASANTNGFDIDWMVKGTLLSPTS